MGLNEEYTKQVELLLGIIPTISNEECFALKGGSAINLFYQDLPRLSVDLDLTYLPIEDRETSYNGINTALEQIKDKLNYLNLNANLLGRSEKKIICSNGEASVKIEPNYVMRGTILASEFKEVSASVQDRFGYAKMKVLSFDEIYAGKICAALDRQHPRDLFDIKKLYELNGGLSPSIINCLIVYLFQHSRPLYELLDCNIKDNSEIFEKEFIGMTEEPICYQNLQDTLSQLKTDIKQAIVPYKKILLDFVRLQTDFSILHYKNVDQLPAVKWKINNLKILKEKNKSKFEEEYKKLKDCFDCL